MHWGARATLVLCLQSPELLTLGFQSRLNRRLSGFEHLLCKQEDSGPDAQFTHRSGEWSYLALSPQSRQVRGRQALGAY